MSEVSEMKCTCCGAPLERLRYFPRQLLTADDMRAEQDYYRERLRRHNRYLHGWGVVCGCNVEAVSNVKGWQVRVCPGFAVGPQGDEILISDCIDVDLTTGAQQPPCTVRWPCPPVGAMPGTNQNGSVKAYVAVRYAECFSRPVRVHPAGCGCDETGCEYSRVRDSFEIKVLWELPKSHTGSRADDEAWCTVVKNSSSVLKKVHSFPIPACPECLDDPWVVLATVTIPPSSTAATGQQQSLTISYDDCRVLLATQRLQVAVRCAT